MLANEGRMKCQNDSIFGDTCCDEFCGDAIFDAIVMYPQLICPDFNVNPDSRVLGIDLPNLSALGDNGGVSEAFRRNRH